jgi:glycosyltransferase involved in cell wall biosynthesis
VSRAGEPSAGNRPQILVLSSLFPSAEEPLAGLFIRERMLRVAEHLPVSIVAPVPWFPLQGILRRWRPHFRLTRPVGGTERGIAVHRPRYWSIPGPILLDGAGMAAGSSPTVRRLTATGGPWVIDAHFAYPDGYAASVLARRLGLPFTVTLRGTEVRHARMPTIRRRMIAALGAAARVFSVSASLRELALELGVAPGRAIVVPNGVDTARFRPVPREEARRRLGIAPGARVLVTVGGLVRRKGYHRVIQCLSRLREHCGEVVYLAVGGASREGDDSAALRAEAAAAGVADCVRFLGPLPPDELSGPLSAADVFVLASTNEGWANVLLEAMACGTPVVASDVGGNREVVASPELGTICNLDDPDSLPAALEAALGRDWDREAIVAYARRNSWRTRIEQLVAEFSTVAAEHAANGRVASAQRA